MSESIRKNIIDWMKIISSSEMQLKYEKEAAGLIAGDEIVENWFSAYIPDDPICIKLFSKVEIAALNQFHKEFEKCASDLPTTLSELHGTTEWQATMHNAKKVIEQCAW